MKSIGIHFLGLLGGMHLASKFGPRVYFKENKYDRDKMVVWEKHGFYCGFLEKWKISLKKETITNLVYFWV